MNNSSSGDHDSFVGRRKFIARSLQSAGALLAIPAISKATNSASGAGNYTVGQVMDLFIKEVPGGALPHTVDTLKAGSRDTTVTGIVTTMFATIEVIRKAVDLGANFIIAHEPTFYNHMDDTSWLLKDDVYNYKATLLQRNNIAIWRNHDYIHSLVPDGVTTGVLEKLHWKKYAGDNVPTIVTLPGVSLKDLIANVKEKLAIEKVRYIGDPDQSCSRVLLMPGAAGGRSQVTAIVKVKPDVLVCGEIQEWETAEYVRDARAKGDNISLVVLGHIASEAPGSEFMLNWLKEKIPSITSTHISSGNSLSFL
ncbi:MAG: Nif3-like dinuclear metal center hexameric protein [Ginsengibacter sp.]